MKAIAYRDPAVDRIYEAMGALIAGEAVERDALESELCELAERNSPATAAYWKYTERGRGIPDTAFKRSVPYLFPDEAPARVFATSGTSGGPRGQAPYSARGLDLMRRSILRNAAQHLIGSLERPIIVRLVPPASAAPDVIMAYGMDLIASHFGDPELSRCVIGPRGVDAAGLAEALDIAEASQRPVVLIGGSFVFVNVCDALAADGRAWRLHPTSRAVDAGGFKGRSRALDVDALRAGVGRAFGIPAGGCTNLFGMTELASQLYDASDRAVGPLRERPKGALPFVEPRVRDIRTLLYRASGRGLLEVRDYCILDRPFAVLTGDFGIACEEGVAITGRVEQGVTRGCSIALDALTRHDSLRPPAASERGAALEAHAHA